MAAVGSVYRLQISLLTLRPTHCTETDQQFLCQAEIQNRSLKLVFEKGRSYKYAVSKCQGEYNGQPVGCQEHYASAPVLSKPYEVTDLGLSFEQLQAVRYQYWQINALLDSEDRLIRASAGLSIAGGVIAAIFVWLHPNIAFSKGLASLACGFGMYRAAWSVLMRVPSYEVATRYGYTFDTLNWVINIGAIALGTITAIAVALLLWQKTHGWVKTLIIVISGVSIFSLCALAITFNTFPSAPAAEISSGQGDLLTQLARALAAIFAVTTVGLGLRTRQAMRRFLTISSGFGIAAFSINFLWLTLLAQGFID